MDVKEKEEHKKFQSFATVEEAMQYVNSEASKDGDIIDITVLIDGKPTHLTGCVNKIPEIQPEPVHHTVIVPSAEMLAASVSDKKWYERFNHRRTKKMHREGR